MSFDWNILKTVLSEQERDRCLCLFFSSSNVTGFDWDKATRDFGSASVDSMKVSHRNMYKKIEKAGGKLGDDGTAVTATNSPAKATPRKRKAAAGGDGESASPKKRGRKPKKAVEADEDGIETVKGEPAEDDEELK